MMNELNQVTERIIGCAFKVANTLGMGSWKKSMRMHWLTSCG